jgi:MFS transporter, DHA3 family, macrolide efflux protein
MAERDRVLPLRFWILWSGQVATLVGNSVLRFAFVIHAWVTGGQATRVVLLTLFAILPQMLLSPTAGALVDRCRKRTALRLADLGGLLVISALSAVWFSGNVRLWEIYLAVALSGAAAAFQYPALSSAVPLLVSEGQYQRANGVLAAASSLASVFGPVLAESAEGMRYLFARPSLRGLTLVFFTVNLVMVFGFAVLQPMILARTGGDADKLAVVMSSMGIGGVAGGFLVGASGGPRNRIRGMTLGVVGLCLSALIGMAVLRSVAGWCVAIFVGALVLPVINSAEQSTAQTKVPASLQGRVFGASLFLTQISALLALAVAGPLADHVFEPHDPAPA